MRLTLLVGTLSVFTSYFRMQTVHHPLSLTSVTCFYRVCDFRFFRRYFGSPKFAISRRKNSKLLPGSIRNTIQTWWLEERAKDKDLLISLLPSLPPESLPAYPIVFHPDGIQSRDVQWQSLLELGAWQALRTPVFAVELAIVILSE